MNVELTSALDTALLEHRAGRLAEAEVLYRQILRVDPRHADALHLLGVVAHQAGRQDLAQAYIREALSCSPANAIYHCNLGAAQQAAGDSTQALESYRTAAALLPRYAEAHYNIGCMLEAADEIDEAVSSFKTVIRYRPESVPAHVRLALALQQQGESDEAVASFQRAIELDPTRADAHAGLADALFSCGRLHEAAAGFQRSLELAPDSFDALKGLGMILKTLHRHDEAEACFRRAIELRPDVVEPYWSLGNLLREIGRIDREVEDQVHALKLASHPVDGLNNLGIVLKRQGKLDEALRCYRRVLELDPRHASAYNNIGNVQLARNQLQEALQSYDRALDLRPHFADAWNNSATVHRLLGALENASVRYRRAAALNPSCAEVWNNLAVVAKDRGQIAEAVSGFREALRLQPSLAEVHSNLLMAMNYDGTLDPDEMYVEHCRWGDVHGEVSDPLPCCRNDRNPARKLRVGYVSPDFRDHSMAYFMDTILANHDHRSFEVFAYAEVSAPDAATARLRQLVPQWRNTYGIGDRSLAESIRQDGIDLLVDLAGHTAGNRLRMFAWQPAPVQLTGLGYGATTGLRCIHYRLTDQIADPQGEQERHTEELIRLPHGVYCYQPPSDAPPVGESPALRNGFVTFGSFNSLAKLSPQALSPWCQLLNAVPRAKLLLKDRAFQDAPTCDLVRDQFAKYSIDGSRLELIGRTPMVSGHLDLYGRIDVALDPFPYTGLTTTYEALWMGVPVLTLRGTSFVGRLSASVLTFSDLTDLIAETPQEYISKGIRLTEDLKALSTRRGQLRNQLAASSACDRVGYTRALEQAYRQIWQRWCRESEPGG